MISALTNSVVNSSSSSYLTHSFLGSFSLLDFWDTTALIVILPRRLFLTQFSFLDPTSFPSL